MFILSQKPSNYFKELIRTVIIDELVNNAYELVLISTQNIHTAKKVCKKLLNSYLNTAKVITVTKNATTHLNTVKVTIVSSRPKIDTPHPIQVVILNDNGFEPLWFTSMSNAKFVKCWHSHLIVSGSFPGYVWQPSVDQARK